MALDSLRDDCERRRLSGEPGTNSFFAPGRTRYEFERTDDGFTFWIREMPVVLVTGDAAANPITAEANRTFTENFERISERSVVFADLRRMYELYNVAQSLRHPLFDYDFSFWLDEYPLAPVDTPRQLPGFDPIEIRWACWSFPGREYEPVIFTTAMGGGVIMDFRDQLDDYLDRFVVPRAVDPMMSTAGQKRA